MKCLLYLSVGGRGSGATLGRGRLLPVRGFRLGIIHVECVLFGVVSTLTRARSCGYKNILGDISVIHVSANCPVCELRATSSGCERLGVFFVANMTRSAALVAIVLAQATAFVAPPAAAPALTPRQGLLEPYGSQKSASKHDRTARLLALARRRFRPIR